MRADSAVGSPGRALVCSPMTRYSNRPSNSPFRNAANTTSGPIPAASPRVMPMTEDALAIARNRPEPASLAALVDLDVSFLAELSQPLLLSFLPLRLQDAFLDL